MLKAVQIEPWNTAVNLLALDFAAPLIGAYEVVYEVSQGSCSCVKIVDQPVKLPCIIAEMHLLYLPFKGPIEGVRHKLQASNPVVKSSLLSQESGRISHQYKWFMPSLLNAYKLVTNERSKWSL